ncbi:MAG: DUF6580 family putative transport protein [Patescibacteria group bacterium]
MTRTTLITVLLLIAYGTLMRLLPHTPNMTPVTALAIVGSLYFGKRIGLVVPTATLAMSDLFIGFYDWRIMASVYGSFAAIGVLSWLSRKPGVWSLTLPVILSPFLFFFITNGAVWAFSPWYEKSISGLLHAYEMGIPFLKNMLLGDLLYTVGLVGVIELVRVAKNYLVPFLRLEAFRTFFRRSFFLCPHGEMSGEYTGTHRS